MSALDGFYSTWNKAKDTFGVGTPTDGSQHDGSSQLLKMKGMVESAAQHDGWQGKGAEAYAAANKQHAGVYGKLAELDKQMAAEVTNAANIVTNGRNQLDTTKSWVDSAVNSLPSSLSAQARENSLIPIAKEGITQVNNTVRTANGDMLKIGFRLTGLKNAFDELQHQKLGPTDILKAAGERPADNKKDPELNSENGRADGDALQNGAGRLMTPEYRDRLLQAGTLSEQQLADLATGKDIVIGEDRMAYLYQLSQSLNGKSPDEIKAIESSLPDDEGRALAQSLLIVSNANVHSGVPNTEGVTDATRDNFVPAAGSIANLPDGVFNELTRNDRTTTPTYATPSVGQKIFDSTVGAVLGGDPNAHDVQTIHMKGVAGLQDVKDILLPAGTGYANGSEATKALLETASQYSNADIDHPYATSDAHGSLKGALADVVQYAGSNDRVSMTDLATGGNGDKFLRGLFQEHWGDESNKVGNAFRWINDDPSNSINGTMANEVAHYLAENKTPLQNLPGGGGTFGDVNSGLAAGVAQGLSPYVGQLAGLSGPHNGIEQFHHSGEAGSVGMSDMYSVLDQSHESAGIINAATSNAYEKILVDTAKNGYESYNLEIGGRLLDAMELGAKDSDLFARETAQWEQAVKEGNAKDMIDNWKDIFQLAPYGDKGWALAQAGFDLDPGPGQNPATIQGGDVMRNLIQSAGPVENTALYRGAILDGLIQSHPEIAKDPSLDPIMTNGSPDPSKFYNNADAARLISHWFDTNAKIYAVDEADWNTQIKNGADHDDW